MKNIFKRKPKPKPFPFTLLPLELQLHISSYLAPLDLYSLRLTSHSYQSLLPAPTFKDFLRLEEEVWHQNMEPDPSQYTDDEKRPVPKSMKYMACHTCERYRPVYRFQKRMREEQLMRPGWRKWGKRECRECDYAWRIRNM